MPFKKKKKNKWSKQPKPPIHNFKDLEGQRFGRLVILYYAGKVIGRPCWICLCDCGTTIITSSKSLNRGFIKRGLNQ